MFKRILGILLVSLMFVGTARAQYGEVSYTAAGTATYGVTFPFLERSHVTVTVNGVSAPFTWDNDSQVTLDSTPSAGSTVRIYRVTPIEDPEVTFTRGSRLTADRMNRAILQSLYSLQEVFDDVGFSDPRIDTLEDSITDLQTRLTNTESETYLLDQTLGDVLQDIQDINDWIANLPENENPAVDVTAPAVPVGLRVTTVGSQFVNLAWDANTESDFSHYEIGRAGYPSGSITALNGATTSATTYSDGPTNGPNNGVARQWAVRAYDLAGNVSAWTGSVIATPNAVDPPDDPVDLKFDFQPAGGVTEAGHTAVGEQAGAWDGNGYGWSTATTGSRDRSAIADASQRDFVYTTGENTFNIEVEAGTYDVTVEIGDGSADFKADVYIEGTLYVSTTTATGSFLRQTFTVTADSVLSIRVVERDGGWARLNSLTVVDNSSGTVSPPYSGGTENPPSGTPTPGEETYLGINLHEVKYWSAQIPFKNVVRQARATWEGSSDNGNTWVSGAPGVSSWDSNGWPIMPTSYRVRTVMLNDLEGDYPSGTYTVTWDGSGTVKLSGDADLTATTSPATVSVTAGDSGIWLAIYNSNPANPVRNVKILLPGFSDDYDGSFNPDFLGALEPFKVIRFMDWQRTNSSGLVNYADLPGPDYFTMGSGKGVALELMVELANTLEADVWFCMPHQASDAFIVDFATYVKNNLHAGGKAYVEWSNEIWNGFDGFSQHDWVEDQAGAPIGDNAFYDKWAERVANTHTIWTNVWAPSTARLVRVMAGQAGDSYKTNKVAERLVPGSWDAISCAFYFGHRSGSNFPFNTSSSLADVKAQAASAISGETNTWLANHATLAATYSVDFIGYEGGQHYVPNHYNVLEIPGLGAKFLDMQDDAEMSTMYDSLMDVCYNNGMTLMCFFNDVKQPDNSGPWGHLVEQDGWKAGKITDPANRKYKAIMDWTTP